MLYLWAKVAVGLVLAANFALPLHTVVSSRQLWDEPMALLVGDLSLCCLLFGLGHVSVGLYDLAQLQWRGLCVFLQYSNLALVLSFKAAELGLAVDQLIAVAQPLQHYRLMSRCIRILFPATALTWLANVTLGLSLFNIGMPTAAENLHRRLPDNATGFGSGGGGEEEFQGCRWETTIVSAFVPLVEFQLLASSLVTTGLFVYTGVIGLLTKARLGRQLNMPRPDDPWYGQFTVNYRAFRKILFALWLTLSLDVVGTALRVTARFVTVPAAVLGFMHQARLFGLVLEGWVYGMFNQKMRKAYAKKFCRCLSPKRNQVDVTGEVTRPMPDSKIFIVTSSHPEERNGDTADRYSR